MHLLLFCSIIACAHATQTFLSGAVVPFRILFRIDLFKIRGSIVFFTAVRSL